MCATAKLLPRIANAAAVRDFGSVAPVCPFGSAEERPAVVDGELKSRAEAKLVAPSVLPEDGEASRLRDICERGINLMYL